MSRPSSVRRGPTGATTDQRTAAETIVRRARNLDPTGRRRLGRWTSAALRDPRFARPTEIARRDAQAALDGDPDLRRTWETVSRPLFEGLKAATVEERRWRLVLLVSHFVAILAIVNLPAGVPPAIVLVLTLAAPVSAWVAWGRGTGWLGAIHAALADIVGDRIDETGRTGLRRAWANAVEAEPPVPPPTLGLIGALAPSALLVIAFIAVAIMNARPA